jgi:phage baseplate assembly protein W
MADLKPFEIYEEIEGAEEAGAGVLSLIMTQLGEMPYFQDYGSNVRAFVDDPTSTAIPQIKADVARAITGKIPGVTLVRVVHELVDNTNNFSIVYGYNGTEYTVAL